VIRVGIQTVDITAFGNFFNSFVSSAIVNSLVCVCMLRFITILLTGAHTFEDNMLLILLTSFTLALIFHCFVLPC
jgi:hypothetical protein